MKPPSSASQRRRPPAALITLLRQLIIIPVESAGQLQNRAWPYGLITAAVVAVGITFFLVRRGFAVGREEGEPAPPTADH